MRLVLITVSPRAARATEVAGPCHKQANKGGFCTASSD